MQYGCYTVIEETNVISLEHFHCYCLQCI